MPLMPKRVKYRKQQRGSLKGNANSGNRLAFGEYGLMALERAWVTAKQIEACRVAISRSMKRKGKMWTRVYPDLPITKKPLEVRQGKGKGPVEQWVVRIRPGRLLFELDGIPAPAARDAMRLAASKLGIPTKFVERHAA